MKNVLVLAVAALAANTANAAEMKWNGSAGWRYEQSSLDNSLGGTSAVARSKANNVRANIGVTGGWENVEWGTGIRTVARTANSGLLGGNGAAANDDHSSLQNATDLGVGFEQAWFRYVRDLGGVDMAATVGRQKNVFIYDNVAQSLFDNDVRFDGLSESFKFGMFGLNLGQYVLGGKQGNGTLAGSSNTTNTDATDGTGNQQNFRYLFGFQPHMSWKFSDDIEAMFAVGYYIWNDQGAVNSIYGSPTVANTFANLDGFRLQNSRQWQFTTAVSLPYNLSFNGEFVMNKKQNFDGTTLVNGANATPVAVNGTDADRTAWSAGLTYGAIKKAHDFSVGYAYGSKGIASVANAYSYERFLAGQQGHTVSAAYAIADNFTIGAKALFLKEKNPIGTTTGVATADAREIKNNYWQVTAGVMF
jgi:hypothetical protein